MDLYELLPAIIKKRDSREDLPPEKRNKLDGTKYNQLRGLYDVFQTLYDHLEDGIDDQYRDWFIETCSEEMIPLIGSLVGCGNLEQIKGLNPISLRSFVGNLVRLRRMKGTVEALRIAIESVCGYRAYIDEVYRSIARFPSIDAIKPDYHLTSHINSRTKNPIGTGGLMFLHDPFSPGSTKGWKGVKNLGIHTWEKDIVKVCSAKPFNLCNYQWNRLYSFHPFGASIKLFNNCPEQRVDAFRDAFVPSQINPGKLREQFLSGQTSPDSYYGVNKSLCIYRDGKMVDPAELNISDIKIETSKIIGQVRLTAEMKDHRLPEDKISIDPQKGYFYVGADAGSTDDIAVDFTYSSYGALGILKRSTHHPDETHVQGFSTTEISLDESVSDNVIVLTKQPKTTIIQSKPMTTGSLSEFSIHGSGEITVILRGIWHKGRLKVILDKSSSKRSLNVINIVIEDSTLALLDDSLLEMRGENVEDVDVNVEIRRSIVGSISINCTNSTLGRYTFTASDSIIDLLTGRSSDGAFRKALHRLILRNPDPLTLIRCTVSDNLGIQHTAEDSIIPNENDNPNYISKMYGDSNYFRLSKCNESKFLCGSTNDTQLGAYGGLFKQARERNIQRVIDEFMPFGLRVYRINEE